MGDLSISVDESDARRLRVRGDATGTELRAVREAAVGLLDGSTAELIIDVTGVTAVGAAFTDLLRTLANLAARVQRSLILEVPESGLDWRSTPISPAIRIESTRDAAWAPVTPKPAPAPAEQGAPRREGTGYVTSYGPNRRCTSQGCTTTLSRYNSDPMCWLHSPDSNNRRG